MTVNLAEEVINRARQFGADNPQQQSYLSKLVASQPSEVAVPALISVIATAPDSESTFPEQHLAGILLWHSTHNCPVSVVDVLKPALSKWNLSVKELPWYLCREFGSETVLSVIDQIRSEQQSNNLNRTLDTLAFWVRNYEPSSPRPAL